MTKTIILTFDSPHDVIRYFSIKFGEALERKGVDVVVLGNNEQDAISKKITEMKKVNHSFTSSFNLFMVVSEDKKLYFPHFCYCIDPSPHLFPMAQSKGLIIGCGDKLDLDYLSSKNINNTFFLPLAIDPQVSQFEEKERIYDVVFLGRCYNPVHLKEKYRKTHQPQHFQICEEAIIHALAHPEITFWLALDQILQEHSIQKGVFPYQESLLYVDTYLRAVDRISLIRSIKHATVHVFGGHYFDKEEGWETVLKDQPNAVIHPGVSFEDSFKIIQQSKLYLSSTPQFKAGCQERLFSSLACGAVPIASESTYVREIFNVGEELFLYRSDKIQEVNDIVSDLINNQDKRHQIALRGRENVLANHTWDNRVDQFLELFPSFLDKACKELH